MHSAAQRSVRSELLGDSTEEGAHHRLRKISSDWDHRREPPLGRFGSGIVCGFARTGEGAAMARRKFTVNRYKEIEAAAVARSRLARDCTSTEVLGLTNVVLTMPCMISLRDERRGVRRTKDDAPGFGAYTPDEAARQQAACQQRQQQQHDDEARALYGLGRVSTC